MIVKNECKIIQDTLKNVLPQVDSVCITDTGSTDNTIEVMKDILTANKPSKIQECPFVDFGTSRTQSLRNAEQFLKDNISENAYLLVMDADDIFHAINFSWKSIFDDSLHNSKITSIKFPFVRGSSLFYRTQLFKADGSWTYTGVLHEQCSSAKDTHSITLSKDQCQFDANTSGSRSQDPQKQAKDAIVLSKALVEEPDNERQVFYLAQSYRDSGQNELAIKQYLKRWSMKRWCEEQFYSAWQLTTLLKSSEWAWRSLDACPDRAEALVAQMSHCRSTNTWSQELQAMAYQAWKNFHGKIPRNNLLFVDQEEYSWKILDEVSVIAFQTGHIPEAQEALKQLILESKYPEVHHNRLIQNMSQFR